MGNTGVPPTFKFVLEDSNLEVSFEGSVHEFKKWIRKEVYFNILDITFLNAFGNDVTKIKLDNAVFQLARTVSTVKVTFINNINEATNEFYRIIPSTNNKKNKED
jgi:hypothetical protein